MDYAEIIDVEVLELGATCDLAASRHAWRYGVQRLVDLDVSPVGELNAGQFQAESFSVRIAACGDKQVCTRQRLIDSILFEDNGHRVSRFSRHAFDTCIQMNLDTLVVKQAVESRTHIFVFFGHQSSIAINHSHSAAESPHGLRKLYSYVATADNEQMFGDLVSFESLAFDTSP